MASIVQGLTTGLKYLTLTGELNFGATQTYKIALYTNAADASPGNTDVVYDTANEVVGAGYTAGGNTLTNNGVAIASNIGYVDFADLTFSSVTLSATGALIYKGTSNEAVLVLDFGGTKTATNGDFVVQFPTADSTSAIIRLGDA